MHRVNYAGMDEVIAGFAGLASATGASHTALRRACVDACSQSTKLGAWLATGDLPRWDHCIDPDSHRALGVAT